MNNENELKQESIIFKINEIDSLHLKRFYTNPKGKIIFMFHGSIENGRIFYSNSGKGLAPFLAKSGFDVYIADSRGRGLSTPNISKNSTFGQTDTINEDIPAFIDKIIEIRGNEKQYWIAHSWGGVLLSSYFAKFEKHRNLVSAMTFLGTKRIISVRHLEKIIKVNIFWYLWASILIYFYGYLPAKKFGSGSDNETKYTHKHTNVWIKGNPWIDPKDKFNYGEAIRTSNLPPVLSITGSKDTYLGHPKDVLDFVKELSSDKAKYMVIGKESGFKNDYDHIDLLTHKDASSDHFLLILDWLNKHD